MVIMEANKEENNCTILYGFESILCVYMLILTKIFFSVFFKISIYFLFELRKSYPKKEDRKLINMHFADHPHYSLFVKKSFKVSFWNFLL